MSIFQVSYNMYIKKFKNIYIHTKIHNKINHGTQLINLEFENINYRKN